MTTAVEIAEVESRGETTVARRAVRRIAAQAAREVAGVGADVQVDADVTGAHAALDVRLPVHYPSPIAGVSEACREHLVQRTAELTELAVSRVDIVVSALNSDATHRSGR
ncbi:Asp23/Gls24 family envelope stress response protein [Nocardia australiensis]|uniref:Asp23/Gls24 family envelope stress response protein n=1 Tax=Nocardia australiensis TaxID=2887191 RepID=UPI001D155DDB|nr:Asp23/Gls24 family envelope stress response protein [Nocardia australiensis]